ncbi:response regulator transcription factor [Rhodococcus ruber]|uniref:Two component transcriptional regulator, LuxR family n=1 Tax=Rhodococcus ruber TaxID=1830 RepID=A0A098BG17_9NOCA|nr:response regulator transcription factor [Rhodococcus ruber]MCD2130065.1 response regulator transcription factor [Rhodococcus ruber]MCZ4506531.1 response regulator transcription factor [Rhodococcus ruber]MCZ4533762.1 response regulator transcription factor [Rhodococcus ruber]MDI9971906.1 response regulator transcription factor [Rhodococcus ruber]MDI9985459.1 response regulator transcription factor [Rhodococcus ruber]
MDDHALFTQGLELLLGTRADHLFDVAGTTTNGDEAVALVGKNRADIVTIDLTLPPRGGLEAIAAVRAAYPATRILALSGTEDLALAERALRSGADGFMAKSSDADALVAPLLALAAGMRVVEADLLEKLLTSSRKPENDLLDKLGPQQVTLWSLLAHGLETTEIAERLHVSERTAKRLVASLIQRVGARNRIEAAAMGGALRVTRRRFLRREALGRQLRAYARASDLS